MLKKLVSGLVLISLTASHTAHDVHVSVTQMQYNAKERVFEISIRVFTDDLEKALSAASTATVSLTGTPNPKNDLLLEKYVQAHFGYANSQKQPNPFNYVGHEIEVDAHWLYLELPCNEPFRGGLLKQNVLMELFADQVNMVNITYQGKKKTLVFRKNESVQAISFD